MNTGYAEHHLNTEKNLVFRTFSVLQIASRTELDACRRLDFGQYRGIRQNNRSAFDGDTSKRSHDYFVLFCIAGRGPQRFAGTSLSSFEAGSYTGRTLKSNSRIEAILLSVKVAWIIRTNLRHSRQHVRIALRLR